MPSPELLVDKELSTDKENVYFISLDNLNQLRFVKASSFSKATIRNCNETNLNGYNLQSLFNSLEKGASATITVDQHVSVLQEYDANTISVNAELAIFKNIRTNSVNTFCEGLESDIETISITLLK